MSRKLLLVIALLVSLGGLTAAYLPYRSYAAIWRRPMPKVPRCIVGARIIMKKPSYVSGDEPNILSTGETVYLTPDQTIAFACLERASRPLADRFARAFTEIEPERRALELLKILRDVPPGEEHDIEAASAYFVGAGSLAALPDLPEVRAVSDEMEDLQGCRFNTRRGCAKRPPIPVVVWITGVPSALLLLVVVGALGRVGFLRLRDRWRARRAARAQGSTSSIKTPPVALG